MARRTFGTAAPYITDPVLEEYLTDLSAAYGREFRVDLHAAGDRNSFTTMADGLVHGLSPPPGPLDLVVLTHTAPDADPRRVTASYLSHVMDGDPLAFAIADSGVAAPFTALRLLGTYARASGFTRAMLVLLDQTTLPYDTDVPPQLRASEDVGIALIFEGDPTYPAFGVRQRQDVDAATARDTIAGWLAELAADTPVTCHYGSGLGSLDGRVLPSVTARIATGGGPCTATWAGLTGWPGLPAPGVPGPRTVIADYDTATRTACCAVLDAPQPA